MYRERAAKRSYARGFAGRISIVGARAAAAEECAIENIDQLLETATEAHRAAHLAEARRLYARVLAAAPAHTLALFRSGLLELQDDRPLAALALIEKAVAAAPGEGRYQLGLAQTLQTLARFDDAAAVYRRVLELDPQCVEAHFGLGCALHRRGALDAAAAAYRDALTLRADDAQSLGHLGAVLRELGEIGAAIEALEAALALEPRTAAHAVNLGIALCERRDFAAAERVLHALCEREPQNAEAAFNLGNALRGLGRRRDALGHWQRAVALRPDYAEALNNLGNLHKELGDFSAAQRSFDAALQARPDYVVALNNAGCLMRTLGRLEAAEDLLRRGLAIDPQHAALHDNLGTVLKDGGRLDAALECFRQALALDPTHAATHANLAYALNFRSRQAAPILEECLRWNERFAAPLVPDPPPRAHDRSLDRRLRIGYVSPDFRDHCQSLFTLPLLAHHDHEAFEIFCYSSVERPDEHTRRLRGHADVWRDVRALDDAALARLVREDGIDILVDLTMHMSNGRPLLFARKPAPLQIAWLAYPGTTGLSTMDYRLSDARLDPPEFAHHYREETLLLEDSFWCYDPLTDEPRVNTLPALTRGYVTFGCLNNACKLTDDTLALWEPVMRALPQARLVLMAPAGRYRRDLLRRLDARGIGAQRVAFVEFRPRAEYLRSYHDIDLALDTFPYNGHTTSLDALWMGVPTVSRVGATSVGRGGLSQLFHVGFLDLAADSDSAFAAAAIALARDLPRLAALRAALRTRLERSALMDAARFARSIEAAYREAWTRYCRAR